MRILSTVGDDAVRSDDGTAMLHLVERAFGEDAQSWYAFYIDRPAREGGRISGELLVMLRTTWRMLEENLDERGVDIRALGPGEFLRELLDYTAENGFIFRISHISLEEGEPDLRTVIAIRDKVLPLIFRRESSFLFNNDDPRADPNGYYPDEIYLENYAIENNQTGKIRDGYKLGRGAKAGLLPPDHVEVFDD